MPKKSGRGIALGHSFVGKVLYLKNLRELSNIFSVQILAYIAVNGRGVVEA